jgi:rod shape-determining protein MreD
MLLVVVSWSLLRGAREGVLWGFLGGLALDFLSGLPLGSCALTLTLTAYLASLGQLTLYRTSPLFPSGLALTASVVHDCLLMVLLSLLGHAVAWRDLLLQVALPSAVLGSLAMPLVHRGLTRLHERTRPEEMEL